MSASVVLPWPPKDLHPNARVHWAKLAKAKKVYRHACYVLTKQAGIRIDPQSRPLVSIEFVPPDRRRRDVDGMLAAMKSGLDGMADAIGCDDSRWCLTLVVSSEIGGMVRVQITESP